MAVGPIIENYQRPDQPDDEPHHSKCLGRAWRSHIWIIQWAALPLLGRIQARSNPPSVIGVILAASLRGRYAAGAACALTKRLSEASAPKTPMSAQIAMAPLTRQATEISGGQVLPLLHEDGAGAV